MQQSFLPTFVGLGECPRVANIPTDLTGETPCVETIYKHPERTRVFAVFSDTVFKCGYFIFDS